MGEKQTRAHRTGIAAKRFEFEAGESTGWHSHDHSQLLYAVAGTMTLTTEAGLWVVPSLRAVWIPGKVPHSVFMNTKVSMRTAYFERVHSPSTADDCFVVHVGAFLRELMVAATEDSDDDERTYFVHSLLLKELERIDVLPLHLPQPTDPLLKRATEIFLSNPSIKRSLREISQAAGSSQRNFSRLFKKEMDLTFGQWRQQAILLHALQRLASDDTISQIAFDLGYESVSAFTHMFRMALGTTPSKYFAVHRGSEEIS